MTNREYEEYIAPVQPVNATDYLKVPAGCPEPTITEHRLHVAKVLVANHKLTWTGLSIEQRHTMLDIAGLAIEDTAILLKVHSCQY
jgi:hypothetical protein